MNRVLFFVIIALLPLHPLTNLRAADKATSPVTERKREKALRDNDRAAQAAMARDSKLFNAKQFRELETDYQAASARFREADAKTALETFLKKWTKGNRVGCATLYLAQRSSGDEKEQLLRQCIKDYSDCYFLNGAQVGGLARLYLWDFLKTNGKAEEAEKMLAEIKTKFALANDHSSRLLIDLVQP